VSEKGEIKREKVRTRNNMREERGGEREKQARKSLEKYVIMTVFSISYFTFVFVLSKLI
jgi:hypothetical protein